MKVKKKKNKKVRLIVLGIVGLVIVGGGLFLYNEQSAVINLPIASVDFSRLHDGTYAGAYEGGPYKWRANQVQITVADGKLTGIQLLENTAGNKPEFTNELFSEVIRDQSLQVDVVASSTISTKAYLKAIENAAARAE